MKTYQKRFTLLFIKKGAAHWVIHPTCKPPGCKDDYTEDFDRLVPNSGFDLHQDEMVKLLQDHYHLQKVLSVTVKREIVNDGGVTCIDYEIIGECTPAEGSRFQTIAEIKQAVDEGEPVRWANEAYEVIKDRVPQYLINCTLNNHCIGLTNVEGNLLNGGIEEFFISGQV